MGGARPVYATKKSYTACCEGACSRVYKNCDGKPGRKKVNSAMPEKKLVQLSFLLAVLLLVGSATADNLVLRR